MSITTTIEHVVDIDADPATIFDLWTTADGLGAWWGRALAVDPEPGGEIRIVVDGDHVMVGEFVVVERPHRVVFTFGWDGGDPPAASTTVEVRIEAVAGGAAAVGSRLTLRHAGLPIDRIEAHGRGWRHFVGERLVGAATP